MSIIKLSKEDINQLKNNPYIISISENSIRYTDKFKEKFMELYSNGIMPTQIFRKYKLPPEIIGRKRIDSFSYRMQQEIKHRKKAV